MKNISVPSSAFAKHAVEVKKRVSLLDDFQLPVIEEWTVDWKEKERIKRSDKKIKWNKLDIYCRLLAKKSQPGIYFLMINKADSKRLFELFQKQKKESSRIRIQDGVGAPDFHSVSHVPKKFKESTCIYVGSRREKLNERFKQHLGYGSRRTGALHLARVLALEKQKPEITFCYCVLDERYRHVTEEIESVVQRHLKPFIGKNILGD